MTWFMAEPPRDSAPRCLPGCFVARNLHTDRTDQYEPGTRVQDAQPIELTGSCLLRGRSSGGSFRILLPSLLPTKYEQGTGLLPARAWPSALMPDTHPARRGRFVLIPRPHKQLEP